MSRTRLAARLRRLEAQALPSDNASGQGLASLLRDGQRQTADADVLAAEMDAATPPKGLARLLWEIRYGQTATCGAGGEPASR